MIHIPNRLWFWLNEPEPAGRLHSVVARVYRAVDRAWWWLNEPSVKRPLVVDIVYCGLIVVVLLALAAGTLAAVWWVFSEPTTSWKTALLVVAVVAFIVCGLTIWAPKS